MREGHPVGIGRCGQTGIRASMERAFWTQASKMQPNDVRVLQTAGCSACCIVAKGLRTTPTSSAHK